MRYTLEELQCRNLEVSAKREWLLTNGIGGYAMGTVSGINTRRYHAHLVAAVRPPAERMALVPTIEATIQSGGPPIGVSANQYPGAVHPEGYHYLRHFEIQGVAVWKFRASGHLLEKRLRMHPGRNASTVEYRNTGKTTYSLSLRPLVCHRDHHGNMSEQPSYPEQVEFQAHATVVTHGGISIWIGHEGGKRMPIHGWYYRFEHARENERGLDPRDDLYCPCEVTFELAPGTSVALVLSAEGPLDPVDTELPERGDDYRLSTELKQAAEAFIVDSERRRTILAGLPWFTDWGRDTMIALPGLCLCTGRVEMARGILLDFAGALHQGLIPNRFVEVGEKPDYNTVDATLWFVNAVYKTLQADWDTAFAAKIMPALESVFEWHRRGTLFGIQVDPADGLLRQGEPGVQLTWMDAKVGDWVVTPRHGKPVEINGLWINALRAMEWMATRLREVGEKTDLTPEVYRTAAELAEPNFEAKFWHEVRGHYLDTAEPADASLRPNQLIALSLPFCAADPAHAKRAVELCGQELLTPNGMRTLGPKEPGYRGRFKGPLPELDSAYHQGTVWPWLLGPYVTALVRFTGDRLEAKRVLKEARRMLGEAGLGGVAETYDGDEPQEPGGCPWQAWSVAEILRAWTEDCDGE